MESKKVCSVCLKEKPNTNEYFALYGNLKSASKPKERQKWKERVVLSAQCKECRNENINERRNRNKVLGLTMGGDVRKRCEDGTLYGFRLPQKVAIERWLWKKSSKAEWEARVQKRLKKAWRSFWRLTGTWPRKKATYRQLGIGKWKVQHINKRAVELGHLEKIGVLDLRVLWEAQKEMCYYCGEGLEVDFHVEHKLPYVRGGRNERANLCLSCPTCNLTKGKLTEAEFYEKQRRNTNAENSYYTYGS
jgi:5-methylcytosine-specific restriction endonuclease McrA